MDSHLIASIICITLLAAFKANTVSASIDITQINVNELPSQLPAELINITSTLDDIKSLFKQKCIQVAGNETGLKTFEAIEAAVGTVGECITNKANYTVIVEEIEKATPIGELDEVFNKYCRKRYEALECIEEFTLKVEPCLDIEEKDSREIFMSIIRSFLQFVCYKGGDQIALFFAEQGPECLKLKKDDISDCINSTFADYMPEEGIENIKSIPKFIIGDKQCSEIQNLGICIVQKFEKCPEITPSNIVESLFRFIKNETICRNTKTPELRPSTNAAISIFLSNGKFCLLLIILLAGYEVSKRSQA